MNLSRVVAILLYSILIGCDILQDIIWSYSRLKCYQICPKSFRLKYIDGVVDESSSFSEYGTLFHSIFERYYTNKLAIYELGQVYEQEYAAIVRTPFPPNAYNNLNETYYDKGKEYLDKFSDPFSQFKIIEVEKEFFTDIQGNAVKGFIDLILQDDNGNYIIVDHKSRGKFRSNKEKDEFLVQLYLYGKYIKDKYGVFPSKLCFNKFRANQIVWEDFKEEKYNIALQWVTDIINAIKNDTEFIAILDNTFFCNFLCGSRCKCCNSNCYEGDDL